MIDGWTGRRPRFAPAALSIGLIMVLVAACGNDTTGASSSSDNSKTLTLASVDEGSIEDVVTAFEAKNPGVKVNLTAMSADHYQEQIQTQLDAGTGPDVMTVWPGNGNPSATYMLAKSGYLLDLSDQPWASRLPAGLQDVAKYEGKTYTAIFGVNGIGAVYNKEALDKARLQPPGTWTQLMTFCRAAAAKGTPAFALGIRDNWVAQLVLYALVATTVYSTNRDFDKKMQAGRATFANSGWTAAMAEYQTMYKNGCFQKNPLGTDYAASQELAATGKTLGLVQGNWVIALLKEKNPAGTFILKPLPANDDPASFVMPGAAGAGYGINAITKNKQLALRFVDFVMSPQGMGLFNQKQGSLPSLPDTGASVDPSLADLSMFINGGRTVPFMDQLWPNAKVQQDMLGGIQDVLSGKSTTAEMFTAMQADYRAGF